MRWMIPLLLCAHVVSAQTSTAVTIVEASYGAEETFVDVSSQVRSLLSSGANEFRVGNDTMGGDPIFGKLKSLRLVYRDESGTHEATVREGETFRLGETETSTLPDGAKVDEAPKPKPKVTANGVTYEDAELIKEYPQSVYISHASGKSFLNKADLSADDAQGLGVTSIKQAPEVSTDARPLPASESVSKSEQFPTTSANTIRGASLQQVNMALASLDKRIAEQGGVLKGLIPRTTHLTDLCELWRDYHYGFLNPEIEAMARAQWDVLAKKKMLFGNGYDLAKAEDLSRHCSQKMSALIDEANLWIARRNELAKSQERASEATLDSFAEMFRPVESNMPSIEARRANVKNGWVPLTSMELHRFRSGGSLSPMAGDSEKNAWIMTEVMLGRRPVKDIPKDYRVVWNANSRQAARGRAAEKQSSSSRSVSGFDYSGNFYIGSLEPSGAFNGFRQGPSGAAIINDNFDQLGGWSRPY